MHPFRPASVGISCGGPALRASSKLAGKCLASQVPTVEMTDVHARACSLSQLQDCECGRSSHGATELSSLGSAFAMLSGIEFACASAQLGYCSILYDSAILAARSTDSVVRCHGVI